MPRAALLLLLVDTVARCAALGSAALIHRPPQLVVRDRGGGGVHLSALRDDYTAIGDAVVLVGYGAVQAVVDNALGPLAGSDPSLFELTDSVPAPVLQGCLLAASWLACSLLLNLYDPSLTRRPALPTLVACLTAWISSSAVLLAAAWALQTTLHLGPGVSEAEVGFVTGSLTVVGGWRFVLVSAMPPE